MLAHVVSSLIGLAERGNLPDRIVRAGIRNLLQQRLVQLQRMTPAEAGAWFEDFLQETGAGPIAAVPEKANEQHYEVPSRFFELVLGPHRKYSCCFFDDESVGLEQAEQRALALTCERAGLKDGQKILELGCGWGSLSLWMAKQFPGSQIVAVSNSNSQRAHIEAQASQRGLENLSVITCDINDFRPGQQFDRIVSVEMFEHVRNHGQLMKNIADWLVDDGRLFVHIFCHRQFTYPFEDEGTSSWMARHFFSGGIMPGHDLLLRHQRHLQLMHCWNWDGRHYEQTSNAWLQRMDANGAAVR